MAGIGFEEFFARHTDLAYGLAMGVTGDPAAAEDVTQEAFMRILKQGYDFSRSDARGYLVGTVLNTARNHQRSEARRRVREAASAVAIPIEAAQAGDAAGGALADETRVAVRKALMALREEQRVPLLLHAVENFSQREVARILELPVSTVSHRINEGLTELRSSLGRAGFAALTGPAMAAVLQAGWKIPVPTGLADALKSAAALRAPVNGPGSAASATLKGGLIMKISLGMAAVGLAAGGVLLAVGGKSEESAKVEKPASKFTTPATDPGAEWEDKGPWGGIGFGGVLNGYLDGPHREAMFYTGPGGPGAVFGEDGATNIFRAYDPKTERVMTLIGSGARGDGIDGPFSRVRLGGWGYSSTGGMARGGSSRYRYYTSTQQDGKSALRRLDFAKRVSELAPGNVEVTGCEILVFEDGYFVRRGTSLRKLSHDGKLITEYTLEPGPRESLGPYDPKNDRIYGSSREGTGSSKEASWVVWGWDLKAGGKFFGVIPGSHNPECQPLRKQMATGPFKGSFFWCPGGLGFGPGDPDYRYLYMGGGDESNMYRLDLQKQEWLKLVRTADGKRWRFGEAPGKVQAWDGYGGVTWAADGSEDMYPGYRGWNRKYERVK